MVINPLLSQISLALGGGLVLTTLLWYRIRRVLPDVQGRGGFLAGDLPLWIHTLGALGLGLLTVLILGGALQSIRAFGPFTLPSQDLSSQYSVEIYNPVSAFIAAALKMLVSSAFLEETVKLLMIWLLVRRTLESAIARLSPGHTRTMAILLPSFLGFVFGAGFGAGETLLYALGDYGLLILRGSTAVILHGITGSIAARAISSQYLSTSSWPWLAGSIAVHWVYNIFLALPGPLSYLVYALLAGAMVRILQRFRFQE